MKKLMWFGVVAGVLVAWTSGASGGDRTAQYQEMMLLKLAAKGPAADISGIMFNAARDGIAEDALREPRLTREAIARLAGRVGLDPGPTGFALSTAAKMHLLKEVLAQVDMSVFEGPEREARQQSFLEEMLSQDRTRPLHERLDSRLGAVPTRAVRKRLHSIITDTTANARLRDAAVSNLQHDIPGSSARLLFSIATDPHSGLFLRRAALAHVTAVRAGPGDAEVYARFAADPATPSALRTPFLDAARVARYLNQSAGSPMAKIVLDSAPGVPLREAIDSLDTLKGPDEAALVTRLKAIALDPQYDADTRHAAVGAIALNLGSSAETDLVVQILRQGSSAKLSTVLIKKAGLRANLWSQEPLTAVLEELRKGKDGAVAREAASTLKIFSDARSQAEASKAFGKEYRREQQQRRSER